MHVDLSASRSSAAFRQGRASRRPFGTRPPRAFQQQPAASRLTGSPSTYCCSHKLTPVFTSNPIPSDCPGAPSPLAVTTDPPAIHRRSLLLLSAAAAAAAASSSASLCLPSPAAAKPGAASSVDPGDWSSPGLGAPVDPSQPRFVKLPSGVRYQELNVGNGAGPVAGPGDTVLFDYVLRRSNGYFIYGTVEGVSFQPQDVPTAPVSAKLGSGDLIPGLEEVLCGMSPGSKRRALIPPELGYMGGGELPQPPTFATKRQLENHRREPLLFEVQMLRVGGRK